jgi:hypothetical protein
MRLPLPWRCHLSFPRLWRCVVLQMITNFPEKHTAFILKDAQDNTTSQHGRLWNENLIRTLNTPLKITLVVTGYIICNTATLHLDLFLINYNLVGKISGLSMKSVGECSVNHYPCEDSQQFRIRCAQNSLQFSNIWTPTNNIWFCSPKITVYMPRSQISTFTIPDKFQVRQFSVMIRITK